MGRGDHAGCRRRSSENSDTCRKKEMCATGTVGPGRAMPVPGHRISRRLTRWVLPARAARALCREVLLFAPFRLLAVLRFLVEPVARHVAPEGKSAPLVKARIAGRDLLIGRRAAVAAQARKCRADP